jgi:protein transport protein SEC61 subunit gamma-like protein
MRKFLHECRRVLRVTRKPRRDEFIQVAKVTGLGILLVGFIGFLIMLAGWLLGAMPM